MKRTTPIIVALVALLAAAPALGYEELALLSSASRTSDGSGSTVDSIDISGQEGPDARFFLEVTAASGTSPTLDVTIEALVGGTWYEVGSFAQATAATEETLRVEDVPEKVRASWTLGGTSPDFTFSVQAVRP